MTIVGTIEYWEEQRQKWHGDGTFAYPCRRTESYMGYRVHCLGRWWIVSKRPNPEHHSHRLLNGGFGVNFTVYSKGESA